MVNIFMKKKKINFFIIKSFHMWQDKFILKMNFLFTFKKFHIQTKSLENYFCIQTARNKTSSSSFQDKQKREKLFFFLLNLFFILRRKIFVFHQASQCLHYILTINIISSRVYNEWVSIRNLDKFTNFLFFWSE